MQIISALLLKKAVTQDVTIANTRNEICHSSPSCLFTGKYVWMTIEGYFSWKMGGFIALRLSSYIYEGEFYVFQGILLMKITHLRSKHSSPDYLGKYICRCWVETIVVLGPIFQHINTLSFLNDIMSATTVPTDIFAFHKVVLSKVSLRFSVVKRKREREQKLKTLENVG